MGVTEKHTNERQCQKVFENVVAKYERNAFNDLRNGTDLRACANNRS